MSATQVEIDEVAALQEEVAAAKVVRDQRKATREAELAEYRRLCSIAPVLGPDGKPKQDAMSIGPFSQTVDGYRDRVDQIGNQSDRAFQHTMANKAHKSYLEADARLDTLREELHQAQIAAMDFDGIEIELQRLVARDEAIFQRLANAFIDLRTLTVEWNRHRMAKIKLRALINQHTNRRAPYAGMTGLFTDGWVRWLTAGTHYSDEAILTQLGKMARGQGLLNPITSPLIGIAKEVQPKARPHEQNPRIQKS